MKHSAFIYAADYTQRFSLNRLVKCRACSLLKV
jgi:hypothetical protein